MIQSRKSLGQFLQESGALTAVEMKKALQEQERSGHSLRQVLLASGAVNEADILPYYERELGFPALDVEGFPLDPEAVGLIPEEVARRHGLIAAFRVDNALTVVMTDPLNLMAQDEVRRVTGLSLEIAVATGTIVSAAIDKLYMKAGRLRPVTTPAPPAGDEPPPAAEGSVIRLVNGWIEAAAREGASDIHIEPEETHLRVRFRVDGVLREAARHPLSLAPAVTARVKVMAELDLAEKRRPQDGRARLTQSGIDLDLRVSTFPTLYGENTVLRLLDRRGGHSSLGDLGFDADTTAAVREMIERPHGLFLVTGPTGSGKTTTLYACLDHLNSIERNITTLEDPVEYRLASVRQTQVDPDCELTFARGLRSLLRQDPDVIMVGEIRDAETAEIAIRSALTGHLVLSTLHTNDAVGSLIRFSEMGTEPFLVAQAMVGVMAQRLVRAVCPRCRRPANPPAELLARLGLSDGAGFVQGRGCSDCRGTGYRGRAGVYELLVVSEAIRDAVTAGAPGAEIERLARDGGMRKLREDALARAAAGITTLEEVLRVTATSAGPARQPATVSPPRGADDTMAEAA